VEIAEVELRISFCHAAKSAQCLDEEIDVEIFIQILPSFTHRHDVDVDIDGDRVLSEHSSEISKLFIETPTRIGNQCPIEEATTSESLFFILGEWF
jgi:hypothetical protein